MFDHHHVLLHDCGPCMCFASACKLHRCLSLACFDYFCSCLVFLAFPLSRLFLSICSFFFAFSYSFAFSIFSLPHFLIIFFHYMFLSFLIAVLVLFPDSPVPISCTPLIFISSHFSGLFSHLHLSVSYPLFFS